VALPIITDHLHSEMIFELELFTHLLAGYGLYISHDHAQAGLRVAAHR